MILIAPDILNEVRQLPWSFLLIGLCSAWCCGCSAAAVIDFGWFWA